jgi:hypothetical protein
VPLLSRRLLPREGPCRVLDLTSPQPCAVFSQVAPSQPGLAWQRTKDWVTTAAEIAPLTTEALLHSFLTSSDSLPGATSIDWLKGPALLRSMNNMTSNSFLLAAGTGGGVKQAKVATQAAFRRAADLLQACAAARQRRQQAPSGGGCSEVRIEGCSEVRIEGSAKCSEVRIEGCALGSFGDENPTTAM